jgi:hypothetical protein
MRPVFQLWNCSFLWGAVFVLAGWGAAAADVLTGPPAVASDADGRLELFKVDADGELRYRWQRQPNGDWSAQSSLGGSLLPGLAATTNADGEIEVFAVTRAGHALTCIQQQRPTHNWSGWTVLGGPVVPPATVGLNADGGLEVFTVDAQGAVKHFWRTEPRGEWSAWEDFGGQFYPGLLCVRHRDGRLDLFGVDAVSSHLRHRWQSRAGAPGAWFPWADLGGRVGPGISAGQASDGRLEIFAVGSTNSTVYRLSQAAEGDIARWLPWEEFSSSKDSTVFLEDGLAAAENADGRIEVFGVSKVASRIMHRWQLTPERDVWSKWSSFDAPARPPPLLGRNLDGNLEMFCLDSKVEGRVNHRRQISSHSDWLYWSSMDRPSAEYLPRVWQSDEGLPSNRVQAIAQTPDGYLWVGTQEGLARFDGRRRVCGAVARGPVFAFFGEGPAGRREHPRNLPGAGRSYMDCFDARVGPIPRRPISNLHGQGRVALR